MEQSNRNVVILSTLLSVHLFVDALQRDKTVVILYETSNFELLGRTFAFQGLPRASGLACICDEARSE